jgi:predicted alpha-1,6-mannanase (GH76 family)
MSYNTVLLTLVSLVLALSSSFLFQMDVQCTLNGPTVREMAAKSATSFLIHFYDANSKYLLEQYPSNGNLSYYWNFAQGFDALIDSAQRVKKYPTPYDYSLSYYLHMIANFYEGQQRQSWTDMYVDDMNWMALALLRAYDLTGNTTYFKTCIMLYRVIESQWDESCCGEKLGGIWWNFEHHGKVTASNAGPAILAARLYQHTKDQEYLDFSLKVYNYWFDNMVNHTTYALCDNISDKGIKQCSWKFTYNEGLMIGAGVELYLITKNQTFLDISNRIANFMINNEVIATQYGDVLSDGDCASNDCVEFKGIAFRYLLSLSKVTNGRYDKILASCVNAIWYLARNEQTGFFGPFWQGPAPARDAIIKQGQENAVVMALNLYAEYKPQ